MTAAYVERYHILNFSVIVGCFFLFAIYFSIVAVHTNRTDFLDQLFSSLVQIMVIVLLETWQDVFKIPTLTGDELGSKINCLQMIKLRLLKLVTVFLAGLWVSFDVWDQSVLGGQGKETNRNIHGFVETAQRGDLFLHVQPRLHFRQSDGWHLHNITNCELSKTDDNFVSHIFAAGIASS